MVIIPGPSFVVQSHHRALSLVMEGSTVQSCLAAPSKPLETPAIMVRQPDTTMQPAPQDIQLMSKHRVLSFKPHLRLEWRGQDGQSETEQPDHSASLGDSSAPSTRIGLSVHTGGLATIWTRQCLSWLCFPNLPGVHGRAQSRFNQGWCCQCRIEKRTKD
jgi:hypothetical protein